MDKSVISYWLNLPEEEAIQLVTTQAISVPKVGEVVNIDTTFDKQWLEIRFKHLTEKQINALVRNKESQIAGDFIVVDVKRWIKTQLVPAPANEVFQIESQSTAGIATEIPIETVREDFEVFIEPVKE